MSGLPQGLEITKEDVKKLQQQESKLHPGGVIPADSNAAAMQSLMDKENKSKAEIIEERRAALPLPDDPPTKSDFNSNDMSTTAVGSGSVSDAFSHGNDALRGPATGDSAVRTNAEHTNTVGQGVGREAIEGGIPNDAVARGSKDKAGLKDTTNADKGYPQQSDPASK